MARGAPRDCCELAQATRPPTHTYPRQFDSHRNRWHELVGLRPTPLRAYDHVVLRKTLLTGIVVATTTVLCPPALATKLRVRARPDFHAIRTEAHPGGARVTGTLRDETQTPLAGQAVTLRTPGAESTACETGASEAITDERGRFCFLVRGRLPDRASLEHVRSDYLEAVEKNIALELSAPELFVELEVEVATWNIRGGPQPVRVSLVGEGSSNETHPLLLRFDQAGKSRVLAPRRTISTLRQEEFELDPAELGQPGPATLTAVVGDDPSQPLALRSVPLVLAATVNLSWGESPGPVRPELGFEVELEANSAVGPADSGWVEVSAGETKIGSAKVEQGKATVACRFMTSRHESVQLHARYVPEHPWLSPGPELVSELSIADIPWWWHVPWLVAGSLAAIWIFRAWRRPARRSEPGQVANEKTTGKPGVQVVEPSSAVVGWRGLVVDAHSGQAIADATLRVLMPAVDQVVIAAEAHTSKDGRFRMESLERLPEGARWVAEAPDHSTLSRAVPPYGELRVALSSRRRSLLSHLVRWAEDHGWPAQAAPTPAEVALIAESQDASLAAQWASEIEEAVFGSEAPSRERETHLTQKSPPLRRM